jgi:hypothetical protein
MPGWTSTVVKNTTLSAYCSLSHDACCVGIGVRCGVGQCVGDEAGGGAWRHLGTLSHDGRHTPSSRRVAPAWRWGTAAAAAAERWCQQLVLEWSRSTQPHASRQGHTHILTCAIAAARCQRAAPQAQQSTTCTLTCSPSTQTHIGTCPHSLSYLEWACTHVPHDQPHVLQGYP